MKKFNCAVGALSAAVIAAASLAVASCANNALKAADSGVPDGERGTFHQNGGFLFFLPGKAAVIRIYGSKGFSPQEEYGRQYTAELRSRRT